MNNPQNAKCICTTQGYAPDCPQAFMQNGTLMHTLVGENQLKPRRYEDPTPAHLRIPQQEKSVQTNNESDDELHMAYDALQSVREGMNGNGHKEIELSKGNKHQEICVDPFRNRAETQADYTWATDTDMKQANRKELPNFNPLLYQGTTMTEATIGGFRLNMEVASKKVTEFVPLPPVCLPMIFVDKDLNFSHHFFQGMDILLGKKYMEKILAQEKHSEHDVKKILPALKQLIMAGARPGDTELTMFVKRVLTGTFDTLPESTILPGQDELIVAVNMWGFQYLEPSMRCRDADLRMWLHMSHMKYTVSWFNAFKSSGIPRFAMLGVQDRYESRGDDEVKYSGDVIKSYRDVARPRRSKTYQTPRVTENNRVYNSEREKNVFARIFT